MLERRRASQPVVDQPERMTIDQPASLYWLRDKSLGWQIEMTELDSSFVSRCLAMRCCVAASRVADVTV